MTTVKDILLASLLSDDRTGSEVCALDRGVAKVSAVHNDVPNCYAVWIGI